MATTGTPFCCIVDSVDGGFVTAYGQGLAVAMSGEKTQFTVVTKGGTASEWKYCNKDGGGGN